MKEFGLIKGRHSIPVDDFLLQEVEDVLDFEKIGALISKKLEPYNGGAVKIYVTGLTAATLETVRVCINNNIDVIFMHYDLLTKKYKEQPFIINYIEEGKK